jgi:hypothetical protein
MRSRITALAIAALSAVVIPLAGGPAGARPVAARSPSATVPTLRVVGYGAVQHPHGQTSSASFRTPGHTGCSTLIGDGDGSSPGPLLVEPGTEQLRITLHTARKPSHRSVAVYAEPLTAQPAQRAVHPGSHLAKVRSRAGHAVWQVRTTVQLGAGQPAYLSLHLAWKNRCHGTDESSWTFHVEAAR